MLFFAIWLASLHARRTGTNRSSVLLAAPGVQSLTRLAGPHERPRRCVETSLLPFFRVCKVPGDLSSNEARAAGATQRHTQLDKYLADRATLTKSPHNRHTCLRFRQDTGLLDKRLARGIDTYQEAYKTVRHLISRRACLMSALGGG